MTRDLFL